LIGNVARNKDVGIGLYNSLQSNISGNIINFCRQGIRLENSSFNVLSQNNFTENNEGLFLDEGVYPQESSNNRIYLNGFSNNANDIYSFISSNSWSSEEPVRYRYHGKDFKNYLGNYWSDSRQRDSNGDGISDLPHHIGSNEDDYPLMDRIDQYDLN
jgi:parallel beta-helix repeat protein